MNERYIKWTISQIETWSKFKGYEAIELHKYPATEKLSLYIPTLERVAILNNNSINPQQILL